MKYHFIAGSFENRSTFMPKKPVIKVKGRKMNVIHDNLWYRLVVIYSWVGIEQVGFCAGLTSTCWYLVAATVVNL